MLTCTLLCMMGTGARSATDVSSNWRRMTQRIARAQAKTGKGFERILADVGCKPETLQGFGLTEPTHPFIHCLPFFQARGPMGHSLFLSDVLAGNLPTVALRCVCMNACSETPITQTSPENTTLFLMRAPMHDENKSATYVLRIVPWDRPPFLMRAHHVGTVPAPTCRGRTPRTR